MLTLCCWKNLLFMMCLFKDIVFHLPDFLRVLWLLPMVSIHFVIPLPKWKWQHAPGVHQEASSVGLKRPEAEVAQLFLWLFKDNLHRELWSSLPVRDTDIMPKTALWHCPGLYLHMISALCVHARFSSHTFVTAAFLRGQDSAVFSALLMGFSLWYFLCLRAVNMHGGPILKSSHRWAC